MKTRVGVKGRGRNPVMGGLEQKGLSLSLQKGKPWGVATEYRSRRIKNSEKGPWGSRWGGMKFV